MCNESQQSHANEGKQAIPVTREIWAGRTCKWVSEAKTFPSRVAEGYKITEDQSNGQAQGCNTEE